MSDVTYIRAREVLDCFGREIDVSNFTRPNRDGTLPKSVPDGIPYYPQHFPVGQWKIMDPLPRTAVDLAPWYIPTNAHRFVPEWKDGAATGRMVPDQAYGIHFSELDFTWGCIRVVNRADLEWLVEQIQKELAALSAVGPLPAWITFDAL